MSRALSVLDRIIFFLLSVILIALGLWPILIHFEVGFAQDLAEWVDHDVWAGVPEQSWWVWALGIGSAVCIILGMWWVVANLRQRRFNKVHSEASNEEGAIDTQMAAVSSAIAESIENHSGVEKVQRQVAYQRKRPTITYTITASPELPYSTLEQLAETNEEDFRAAFPDADVDTVYKLHYSKVRASSV